MAKRPRSLPKLGILCGLAAPLLWFAVIALLGAMRPDFSHFSQYISELGERGSATEAVMRVAGFFATGLMHIAFAAALFSALRPAANDRRSMVIGAALVAGLVALNGIGRIGAGVFACAPGCRAPLDPEQALHSLAAMFAFASQIGAALLAGSVFRRDARLRPLSLYSFATAFAALSFLGLMLHSEPLRAGTGLYERLASGVLSLWVFLVAARLAWRPRPDPQ